MKSITVFLSLTLVMTVAQSFAVAEIKRVDESSYSLEVQNTGAQIRILINGKELYNDSVERSIIAQRKLTSVVQEGKNNIAIEGKIVNDERPDVKVRIIKSSRRHISFIYEYKWDKKAEVFRNAGSFEVK